MLEDQLNINIAIGCPPSLPPSNCTCFHPFFYPIFFFCNWILHICNGLYTWSTRMGLGRDGWLRQHKQHRLEGNKRQLQLHCSYSRGQMWSWSLLHLLQEERVRRRGLRRALWRQRCLPQRPRSRVLREELRPWLWPGRTRWPLLHLLHLLQEEVIG